MAWFSIFLLSIWGERGVCSCRFTALQGSWFGWYDVERRGEEGCWNCVRFVRWYVSLLVKFEFWEGELGRDLIICLDGGISSPKPEPRRHIFLTGIMRAHWGHWGTFLSWGRSYRLFKILAVINLVVIPHLQPTVYTRRLHRLTRDSGVPVQLEHLKTTPIGTYRSTPPSNISSISPPTTPPLPSHRLPTPTLLTSPPHHPPPTPPPPSSNNTSPSPPPAHAPDTPSTKTPTAC